LALLYFFQEFGEAMSDKYDIYLWKNPRNNRLIMITNVDENKVQMFVDQWLDSSEFTDCMLVHQSDEFVADGCEVTVATDDWIKQHFKL